MNNKQRISLVLGSGGARGYAHIGVIEELEKSGYEIASISGSSMGALIGALYACDKLDVYKEWVLSLNFLDVAKLLDLSLNKKGFIEGDKVFKVIEEMIGDVMIEDLPIKYTAVATDIVRQKEVWIQEGRLLDAIRASIAIPSIFTPKKIGSRYLIDGGVLNPLPIAPTISDNTDITIAVSLNVITPKKYNIPIEKEENLQKEITKKSGFEKIFFDIEKKIQKLFTDKQTDTFDNLGMFEIMGQTIDIMQNAIIECKMAGYSPDMIIGIPNDVCGFYEFNKAHDIIEVGRIITKESIKSLSSNY